MKCVSLELLTVFPVLSLMFAVSGESDSGGRVFSIGGYEPLYTACSPSVLKVLTRVYYKSNFEQFKKLTNSY